MFNLDSGVTTYDPPAPADREQVRCGLERWRAACAGLADPQVLGAAQQIPRKIPLPFACSRRCSATAPSSP